MKCRTFSPLNKRIWTKAQQFTSFSSSPGQSDSLGAQMKSLSLLLLLLLFFSGQIQGSTEMIQKFLPTGKESTIGFPEEKLTKDSTVSWLYHLNTTIGTYYPNGKTNVMKRFIGKVKISGPTTLMFPSPQESDSGVYFAKVIGDRSEVVMCFNIMFQDQNTVPKDAAPAVSPAAPAVYAVLAIIAALAVAVWLLYYHRKRKLLYFVQDQKKVVLLSVNSQNDQICLPPTQDNGAPHTGDSPVEAAEKTTDSVLDYSPLSTSGVWSGEAWKNNL